MGTFGVWVVEGEGTSSRRRGVRQGKTRSAPSARGTSDESGGAGRGARGRRSDGNDERNGAVKKYAKLFENNRKITAICGAKMGGEEGWADLS